MLKCIGNIESEACRDETDVQFAVNSKTNAYAEERVKEVDRQRGLCPGNESEVCMNED